MIKKVEETKANFIVNLVDCQGNADVEGHIEKEYLRFLKHYDKTEKNIHGRVQYVPNDVWATIMVDTIKNDCVIDYDKDYQYTANLFGIDYNCNSQENFNAIKKGLKDIFYKARKLNATIGIAYGTGKELWNDIYNVTKQMSNEFNVNVELYK